MASIRGTRLVNDLHAVNAIPALDYNATAVNSTVVSLANYNHATIYISTGAVNASASAAVTLFQGTTVAFGTNKALAFTPIWVNTTAALDTYTETVVNSNTFNITSASTEYIIEIDAETLDVGNGYQDLQVQVASPGAYSCPYSVLIVLSGARFAQRPINQISALID